MPVLTAADLRAVQPSLSPDVVNTLAARGVLELKHSPGTGRHRLMSIVEGARVAFCNEMYVHTGVSYRASWAASAAIAPRIAKLLADCPMKRQPDGTWAFDEVETVAKGYNLRLACKKNSTGELGVLPITKENEARLRNETFVHFPFDTWLVVTLAKIVTLLQRRMAGELPN